MNSAFFKQQYRQLTFVDFLKWKNTSFSIHIPSILFWEIQNSR